MAVGSEEGPKFPPNLGRIIRQKVLKAASYAVNNSMNDAKLAEQREMNAVFDHPVPYILKSVAVDYVNIVKGKLTGAIRLRRPDSADKTPAALQAEVRGGSRRLKGSENHLRAAGILPPDKFLAPTRSSERDMYGNIPAYVYVQMLSDLQAFQVASFRRTAKMNRSLQSALVRPQQFYVRVINGVPIGIYKRVGSLGNARKWSTISDIPYWNFVNTPYYKQRYDFSGVARREISDRFRRQFQLSWKRVLNS